ncbi:hypothetical protein HPB51_018662 [Rhipicephalus microplus]|uniref:Uncharacterized protein n=1 Tax=Rhipicephalus microplus TaxID=6941 RepID=A0A9J6DNX5_RHIMP|nr:hypothetical protein HPB51_018662 [Rhipicephalus microplus]
MTTSGGEVTVRRTVKGSPLTQQPDDHSVNALEDICADYSKMSAALASEVRKVTTLWQGPQLRTAGGHLAMPFVVDHVRRITTLKIKGRPHSVNAYVATSGGTTEGVICGLDPNTTPEALKGYLRIRTQDIEILQNLLATPTRLPPKCANCAIRLVAVRTSAPSWTLQCVTFVDNRTLQPDTSALRSVQLVVSVILQVTEVAENYSNLCRRETQGLVFTSLILTTPYRSHLNTPVGSVLMRNNLPWTTVRSCRRLAQGSALDKDLDEDHGPGRTLITRPRPISTHTSHLNPRLQSLRSSKRPSMAR